uniref:Movement protein TGBp3 n=1 Tax=Grapevine rupestris stem pitting-associated virus TaxID=196400 RepID=A0A1L2M1F1_9VIRU|nr:8.4 kDa protein [Grapevine rupestris stem pitting-associated virus]AXL94758.1 TGB protein 3 [Grapevine rupestris stem pitting-associated virus]QIE48963.1 TGB protein 3 [Grapevine rupestris stem pitting-associated virus]QOJ37879.1 TGB protein 3 [Grapevine rupestris stem pitting-associated virus]QPB70008.1 triple gene block 3 [Grapevine rupestris stem pitting-associated virus]
MHYLFGILVIVGVAIAIQILAHVDSSSGNHQGCFIRATGESILIENCGPSEALAATVKEVLGGLKALGVSQKVDEIDYSC